MIVLIANMHFLSFVYDGFDSQYAFFCKLLWCICVYFLFFLFLSSNTHETDVLRI